MLCCLYFITIYICHRPDTLIHIGPILGQLCKTENRPILKSNISLIVKRYRPVIGLI